MVNNFFSRKSCRKYGEARRATNDVTTWRLRVACWISKATCTQAHAHTRTHARKGTKRTLTWNTSCFSTATLIREGSSILRYTHIVRLLQLLLRICMEYLHLIISGFSPTLYYNHGYPYIIRHSLFAE
jgi:hypothetical protein